MLATVAHKTHVPWVSQRSLGLMHTVSGALVNPTATMAQLPHTKYLPETTYQPKPLCSAGAMSPLPRSGCQASENNHDPETA